MHIKFILPSLVEAKGQLWRPIKYSLFPPLGLATLAGYTRESDRAEIVDEHVQPLDTNDTPDLVAIETYVTCAQRAYELADHYRARGSYVVLGGLHATAEPEEALQHADTIVTGPAEEAWPRFLEEWRAGTPQRRYHSSTRTLEGLPPIRRDLIDRRRYLVPNSLVVSRGCPHSCDFCYKESFFRGGRSFYTQRVDAALAQISALPGRHLFFLDDNILADRTFALTLFREMRGLHRIWQGAATARSVLDSELLDAAVAAGLSSLFIGFESLDPAAMRSCNKPHNEVSQYAAAISELHARQVMINASFVFGLDQDTTDTFSTTVDWAIHQALETATFHILTPYPGTALYSRMQKEGRILTTDWSLYDTRHAVFAHPTMTPAELEAGYWDAYRSFYSWKGIATGAASHHALLPALRHFAYAAAWKKFDPLWGALIKLRHLSLGTSYLEHLLAWSPLRREATQGQRATPAEIHV